MDRFDLHQGWLVLDFHLGGLLIGFEHLDWYHFLKAIITYCIVVLIF